MKKLIQVLTCAAALSICLIGCGEEKPNVTDLKPGGLETSAASSSAVPSATMAEGGNRHISQKLSDNVSIDADVTMPDKTQYGTYTLKMVDCDPDRLFGIFSPEGYGSFTKEEQDRDTESYTEANGKHLYISTYDNRIIYDVDYEAAYGGGPEQEIASLMYYYTQQYPDAAPHDLAFMTASELEACGKELFAKLGVAFEPKLQQCVTLTGQEILDFQQEMFGLDSYSEFGTPVKLTEAEDTCYMVFSFQYDGVQLLGPNDPRVSFADGMYAPDPVTATIQMNADGIQSFNMNSVCMAEPASETKNILAPEEAAAVLKEKYEQEIRFGESVIQNAWLEYIPVKDETSYVLKPYWCFRFSENGMGGERINALTGKDLAYGG